jgi:hypothetical protein
LERLARHRAAKLGYRVHRSRRRKSRDNAGAFMLIHKASSTVLLGAGFTATLETILEFMEREQKQAGRVVVSTSFRISRLPAGFVEFKSTAALVNIGTAS